MFNTRELLKEEKKSIDSKPKVIVVGLDIPSIDPDDKLAVKYSRLTGSEKIDKIFDFINKLYPTIHSSNPDSLIVFTWREYGVFDPKSRSITNETKKYLKARMQELTNRYAKLIIVAGPCLIRKDINPKVLAPAMEKQIEEAEVITGKSFLLEEMLLSHAKTQEKAIKLKNSLFVFSGNRIERVGKLALVDEANKEPDFRKELLVTQPAKGRNLNQIITIQGIEFGFQICLDHTRRPLSKKVDLQLILSDPIIPDYDKLVGPCIHVDSVHSINYILHRQSTFSHNIELYSCNLFEEKENLSQIKPIQPFQDYLVEVLEKLIEPSEFKTIISSILAKYNKVYLDESKVKKIEDHLIFAAMSSENEYQLNILKSIFKALVEYVKTQLPDAIDTLKASQAFLNKGQLSFENKSSNLTTFSLRNTKRKAETNTSEDEESQASDQSPIDKDRIIKNPKK